MTHHRSHTFEAGKCERCGCAWNDVDAAYQCHGGTAPAKHDFGDTGHCFNCGVWIGGHAADMPCQASTDDAQAVEFDWLGSLKGV